MVRGVDNQYELITHYEFDLNSNENYIFIEETLSINKWANIFYCLKHHGPYPLSIPVKLHTHTHLYLLLFVCWDISLTPGPTKHPCGVCSWPVVKNHRGSSVWDLLLMELIETPQRKKYFNIALVLEDEWPTIFTCPANTCTCPLKAYAIKNIGSNN